ncbi:MAG: CoA transferase [Acidimicrobiia bacterium]|nr:CoA transferase [Acidimicrobiia bacterium]
MTDVLATWTGPFDRFAMRSGEPLDGLPTYGTYRTDDGHVALGILDEDHFWVGACDALGLADVGALDLAGRRRRAGEIRRRLAEAIGSRSRDEVCRLLESRGVPVAPVLSRTEMLRDPHLRARGVVGEDEQGRPAMGHPVRFERSPAVRRSPAPALDEHRGQGFAPRPEP